MKLYDEALTEEMVAELINEVLNWILTNFDNLSNHIKGQKTVQQHFDSGKAISN